MPYLVRKKLDGSIIQRAELGGKPLIFGRGEEADVPVPDEHMSRQHFLVAPKDGGYVLQDLKSTNGTWVNGKRVAEVTLQPNDRIRAGQTTMIFELGESKGLATVISELAKEKKGYHTLLGEISKEAK